MTARLALAALLLTCPHFATTRVQALDPIYVGPEIWLPKTAQTVAYDGSGHFLAAYACETGICGARVEAASGLVEVHELVTTVGYPDHLRLAFDGQRFLLVWAETRERRDIYAARVMPNGACLDPEGIVVSAELVPYEGQARVNRYEPEVGFDGTSFVVYWLEELEWFGTVVYTTRVSEDGVVSDAGGVVWSFWNGLDDYDLAVERALVAVFARGYPVLVTVIQLMEQFSYVDRLFFSPDWSVSDASSLLTFRVDEGYEIDGAEGAYGYLLGVATLQLSPIGGAPLAAWEGTSHLAVWAENGGTVGLRIPVSGVFTETRVICPYDWACRTVPLPEMGVAGTPTALASNGRGVSLVTMENESARLLTSNLELAASDGLLAVDAAVVALPNADLKNVNLRTALRNKLRSVGNLLRGKAYATAEYELTSFIEKTDGCALALAPHEDDWIRTCKAQDTVYPKAKRLQILVADKVRASP